MTHQNLHFLGWSPHFQEKLEKNHTINNTLHVGRICRASHNLFHIMDHTTATDQEAFEATARTKLHIEHPLTVGDWVLFAKTQHACIIEEVIERRTMLGRTRVGVKNQTQIIAANVDIVFIVTSMNQEFNKSRIERYLIAVWNAGATPIIVLNKQDLADDPEHYVRQTQEIAMGVQILTHTDEDPALTQHLMDTIKSGQTYAFVGSSGVGKSTLHNLILGTQRNVTQDIRSDDDEGRHTTTHRHLTTLSNGGILIDTPGMREFGLLYEQDQGFEHTFEDISNLAQNCKFRDCKHKLEPGCAVVEAVESGQLKARRLRNYQKIGKELAYQQRQQNTQRAKDKRQGKYYKRIKRDTERRKSY